MGRTLGIDDHIAPDGRVMEVLSEHLCEGWLKGHTPAGPATRGGISLIGP